MPSPLDSATYFEAITAETHMHNRERWFGIASPQTGSNWGTQDTLNQYQATSGNGVYGAAIKILGSADTPIISGQLYFDIRRISVPAVSVASPYFVRFIWDKTSAANGITNGTFTEVVCQQATVTGINLAVEVQCPRIASGMLVWAEVMNATNNATINFFIGVHGYYA